MKKKLKITGTIASLFFCLAMLVVGVYAATSATYDISTNVSFTATQHVKATVIAKDTDALKNTPQTADYKNDAQSGANQTIGMNIDGTTNGSLENVVFNEVTLTESNKFYGYKLTITNNDTENDLPIKITTNQKQGNGYSISWNGIDKTTIKNGTPLEIICVVEITNLSGNSVEINQNDLSLKIDLGKEKEESSNYTLSFEFGESYGGYPLTEQYMYLNYGETQEYIGSFNGDYSYSINNNEEVSIYYNATYWYGVVVPTTIKVYDENNNEIVYTQYEDSEANYDNQEINIAFIMNKNLIVKIILGCEGYPPAPVAYLDYNIANNQGNNPDYTAQITLPNRGTEDIVCYSTVDVDADNYITVVLTETYSGEIISLGTITVDGTSEYTVTTNHDEENGYYSTTVSIYTAQDARISILVTIGQQG